MKIKQLGRLTRASVLLYLAAGLYVLSGILGVISQPASGFSFSSIVLYLGTTLLFFSLAFLIWHGFQAVKIRQHLHLNNHMQ